MAANGSKAGTWESSSTSVTPQVNPPVAKKVKPTRSDVENTFKKFASLIHASNRPLPHRYGSGQDGTGPAEQEMTGLRHDLSVLRKNGFLFESLQTIWEFASGKIKGDPVDDKTMIVSISVPNGSESLLMCVDGALDPIDLPITSHEQAEGQAYPGPSRHPVELAPAPSVVICRPQVHVPTGGW
jgi:hypothetical protein